MRTPITPTMTCLATLLMVAAGALSGGCESRTVAGPRTSSALTRVGPSTAIATPETTRAPVAALPLPAATPAPEGSVHSSPAVEADPSDETTPEVAGLEAIPAPEPWIDTNDGLSSDLHEPDCGEGLVEFRIRSGETLYHYAKWSGTPAEVIAEDNGMSLTDFLIPGKAMALFIDDDRAAVVAERQEAFARRRAQRQDDDRKAYLAKHAVVGAIEHTVATGDNGWSIARDHGVPLWLLRQHNSESDFDRLQIGAKLEIPVLGLPSKGQVAGAPATGEEG